MAFRKILTYATPLVLVGGVAATPASAANLLFPDYAAFKDESISGKTFTDYLARDYQDLSVYEYQEMYDYIDAETYAERGMQARAGVAPEPFQPQNWDIDSAQARSDLKSGRHQLVMALNDGAATIAPELAAEAQSKYDCWVEQQEEGWQTLHIARCREGFEAAMADLHKAMMPAEPKVETKAETKVAPPVMEEIARHVIYFDFDEAALNPAGEAKVSQIVADLSNQDDIELYVEGHADRAGPADYNAELAKKRAETVRAELIRHGLEVSKVDTLRTESEGETDPAVETADGVRELRNRRVEIVVQGVIEPDQTASAYTVE
ncbi:MAG: OmpA family protein [Alphaproteobacteria bacterium]|nr:OmpA family protein [Alphaproteobacteria bacterium]